MQNDNNKTFKASLPLDFRSGFEMPSNKILDEKLKIYKVGIHLRAWLKTYLTGRSHFYINDNDISNPNIIYDGFDAGRIISGFLFLIYTAEITLVIQDMNSYVETDKSFLYVDDIWSYFSAPNMNDLKEKSPISHRNVNIGLI